MRCNEKKRFGASPQSCLVLTDCTSECLEDLNSSRKSFKLNHHKSTTLVDYLGGAGHSSLYDMNCQGYIQTRSIGYLFYRLKATVILN